MAKKKTDEKKPKVTMAADVKKATEAKEVKTEEVKVQKVPETPPTSTPKVVERLDKMVEVIPKISGHKFIAGRWYDFEKDNPTEVTIHVARILKERRLIYL